MEHKKKITSYNDLEVYQRAYKACLSVMKEVVPKLPDSEKFDLKDQLSRSSKSIPRLIAEGFAKKHQRAGFQKYLDDAMAESNETQVSICQCRDIYRGFVDIHICDPLINEYDIISKQLYSLRKAWSNFSNPADQKSTT
jgi:four helix bundle protein